MAEPEPKYIEDGDYRDLQLLLRYPAEEKDIEYKAAVEFDGKTDFAAKLVKEILALANSGGGHLVIGYKEQSDGSHAPDPDITEAIVDSYNHTKICQHIGKYLVGQERIKIRIDRVEFGGTRYPVICVFPFQDYPLFCTKDCPYRTSNKGKNILKKGEIYIRTDEARVRVAATVQEVAEWRQLIKEAAKNMRMTNEERD